MTCSLLYLQLSQLLASSTHTYVYMYTYAYVYMCICIYDILKFRLRIRENTWYVSLSPVALSYSPALCSFRPLPPPNIVSLLFWCPVCVCIYLFVCICRNVLWHSSGDQRSASGAVPLKLFMLFSETSSLTGIWGSPVRVGWLTLQP